MSTLKLYQVEVIYRNCNGIIIRLNGKGKTYNNLTRIDTPPHDYVILHAPNNIQLIKDRNVTAYYKHTCTDKIYAEVETMPHHRGEDDEY
jgi:hypothetical protein